MTRATINLITNMNILSSTEFNGDGFPEGYGVLYIDILEQTKSPQDFIYMIEQFNSLAFKYAGQIIYDETLSQHFNSKMKNQKVIDLRKMEYSSDWVFYKNISSSLVSIITTDGKLMFLNPTEQIALYYGSSEDYYTSVADCRKKNEIPEEKEIAYGVREKMFGESTLAVAV